MHLIRRRARSVDDPQMVGLVEAVAYELDIRRPIALLESATAITPMTWGFRNPVVLLPREARQWSFLRLRDVLTHELAHIKRNDYMTQLVSRYACAVYWFNPLVWLAARQLRQERERACDDTVLNAGTKPSEYAHHLLEIARSLKASNSTAFATVAMARPSQLTGRLLDVLDDTRSRRAVTGAASKTSWAVAALLVLPLAGWGPAQPEQFEPTAAEPVPVKPVEPLSEPAQIIAAEPIEPVDVIVQTASLVGLAVSGLQPVGVSVRGAGGPLSVRSVPVGAC